MDDGDGVGMTAAAPLLLLWSSLVVCLRPCCREEDKENWSIDESEEGRGKFVKFFVCLSVCPAG